MRAAARIAVPILIAAAILLIIWLSVDWGMPVDRW